MSGVPDARNDDHLSVGYRRGHLLGDRREFLIALSGEERDGHLQLPESLPERWQRAWAETAQRAGQSRGLIAQAVGVDIRGYVGGLVGHHCCCGPGAGELLNAQQLDLVSELRVGGPASSSLPWIGDPRACSNQNQALYPRAQGERNVQRDPAPHRVSNQREADRLQPGEVIDYRIDRDGLHARGAPVAPDVGS